MHYAPIVIDNGSGICKAGFSGEDAPIAYFPAIVGKPKYEIVMPTIMGEQMYVGEEAKAKKGILNLKYPIQHGIITNWEEMTRIWEYCFHNKLKVAPQEHPCLLIETPRNPKQNRQKMTQIMFETFEVPAFYLSIQAILSLYSSGRTTGIVLDVGDGVSSVFPLCEGYALTHAVERVDLGGRDLTECLMILLNQVGFNFSSSAEFETVREIKEKICYVAMDYDAQMKLYKESQQKFKNFELPDGQTVTIGNQQYRCAEALFQPEMIGKEMTRNFCGRNSHSLLKHEFKEHKGIHKMLYDSIQNCDIHIRKDLYSNIIMSGGTTMLSGIPQRLSKEIISLAPTLTKVKVLATKDRNFLPWIGGSIFSSLPIFQELWITKQQYEETGATIIHRKCF